MRPARRQAAGMKGGPARRQALHRPLAVAIAATLLACFGVAPAWADTHDADERMEEAAEELGEESGEAMDEAAEEAGEAAEEAAEESDEAAGEARDETGEALDEAAEETGEALEDAEDSVDAS